MPNREKLTEKMIRAAEPRSGAYQVFDSEVVGLAIRIHTSGTKAFALNYRAAGAQRKYTIGRWPDWSVVAARERARELRREIDAGNDPLNVRDDARTAPRIGELIERYLEEHAAHLAPRSAVDQAVMLRKLVKPHWKNRLVADIDARDVDRVLTVIAAGRPRPAKDQPKGKRRKALASSRPTPIRANRVGEVLRKMFNLSVQWKMRTDNPAASFRRRLEVERDRFLSPTNSPVWPRRWERPRISAVPASSACAC